MESGTTDGGLTFSGTDEETAAPTRAGVGSASRDGSDSFEEYDGNEARDVRGAEGRGAAGAQDAAFGP
eukprot:NODE_8484_length_408_cov_1.805014_g7609_i0.p2 GENE.NODE_8484_length_408_cov_1.805014_g7609_i0~~NODE_8484_length_408_cov_1.805014_g7609_i0.p2  ORF type:complete len:68 (+),score=8.39 NODE_8484_length_408_cov_1.805014_g7609_i0:107-310(+)